MHPMPRHPCILSSLIAFALLGAVPLALAQQASPNPQARGHGRDQPPPDWMQQAQSGDDVGDGYRRAQQQAQRNSASDAVRRVERDTRGEVLSVERVQYDGRDLHRVKVVDEHGRVRVFMQDSTRGGDRRASSSQNDDDGD